MEQFIKDLIAAAKDANYRRAEEYDFRSHFNGSLIKVYKIESEDGDVLTYWNSSNLQSIRHEAFLNNLVDDLLEETFDGTNDDGWNEIMFELK
jgi:hypothetical protein